MIDAAIHRPVTVAMTYLTIAALGVAAWNNLPIELLPDTELPRLTVHPVDLDYAAAQFDLSLLARETSEGLDAAFSYATDLFDAATIARMAAHWRTLLENMVATPDRRIDELDLLSGEERRWLVQ